MQLTSHHFLTVLTLVALLTFTGCNSKPTQEKSGKDTSEPTVNSTTPTTENTTTPEKETLPASNTEPTEPLPPALPELPGLDTTPETDTSLPATLDLDAPEPQPATSTGDSGAVTDTPSKYAPADVLVAQLNSFVERMESTLSDESEYEEAKARIIRDANTVAALALVLGLHDEANTYKAAAPTIITAATEAGKECDYTTAKKNVAAIKTALTATGGTALTWDKPVANMPQLMKQIPLLDSKVKSSMRRFKTKKNDLAGMSVAMAAIFQASTANAGDTKYPTESSAWISLCLESRNDAAALYTACTSGDQKAAQAAYDTLSQSCDKCHEKFHEVSK